MGKQFRGVYDLNSNRMRVFHPGADRVIEDEIVEGLDDPRYVERFGDDFARARHEIELIQGASEPFERDAFLVVSLLPDPHVFASAAQALFAQIGTRR